MNVILLPWTYLFPEYERRIFHYQRKINSVSWWTLFFKLYSTIAFGLFYINVLLQTNFQLGRYAYQIKTDEIERTISTFLVLKSKPTLPLLISSQQLHIIFTYLHGLSICRYACITLNRLTAYLFGHKPQFDWILFSLGRNVVIFC